MDIVFAGTPTFAAVALEALLEAGHRVVLVLTQPDRAAGRGRRVQSSAVKRLANARGLELMQPGTLRDPAAVAAVTHHAPDVLVVAAYGLLVPPPLLAGPRQGAINIHASLLPRWRGAAPIQRALLAGDAHTGISIMQMDEGLDTGPVLMQRAIPIAADDTARTLHDRLARLGAHMIVEALSAPRVPKPQPAAGITYAAKTRKAEARIEWTESAEHIDRKVRAFDPEPGAYTGWRGEMLKIWRVQVERGVRATPGRVLQAGADGILVACGDDGVRILEMQRPGGTRLPVSAFLAGHPVKPGNRFL
ncbi:MAG: methionyl-tRNA formyltransferase [Betaproteobacteria bacterium]